MARLHGAAQRRAAKMKELNRVLDDGDAFEKQGARAAKKRMQDAWFNRQQNNVGTFWKKGNDYVR